MAGAGARQGCMAGEARWGGRSSGLCICARTGVMISEWYAVLVADSAHLRMAPSWQDAENRGCSGLPLMYGTNPFWALRDTERVLVPVLAFGACLPGSKTIP
jgi:hypothetical protein